MPLNFIMVANGDATDFPINKDYDDCITAKGTTAADFIDTGANYVSDWVCKKPVRHNCSFEDEILPLPRFTEVVEETNIDGSPPLCRECSDTDNEFTRENARRLIQRSYVSFLLCACNRDNCLYECKHLWSQSARRVHGYAMILGCVHLMGFSNFAARYLKESISCRCLLVGCWLWVSFMLGA